MREPLGGMNLKQTRSPVFVALVFLALAVADFVLVAAAASGRIEPALGPLEYAESLLSIVLGLGASLGLFVRRAWGWWSALANVALALLFSAVTFPFDPDLDPSSVGAVGVVWLIGSVLLALLQPRGLRDTLSPIPPDSGIFGQLPVKQCALAGFLLLVVWLVLSVVWGWLIVGIWLALVGLRRLRRSARSSPDAA